MAIVRPFCGLRPAANYAARVATPPYDVIDSDNARLMARDNPYSFFHIIKPEIDLDIDVNPYDLQVYAKGAENFDHFKRQNILIHDTVPHFYIYRQIMGQHEQTGLVCTVSAREYVDGTIKKHELTQPKKVHDRVELMKALKAQTGPVFLAYRSTPGCEKSLQRGISGVPAYDFFAYGVQHLFYPVNDTALLSFIESSFKDIESFYIADGHHRSEAAVLYSRQYGSAPDNSGESGYILSVLFPADQLCILPYNRAIRDLNGLGIDRFLARVSEKFHVSRIENRRFVPTEPFCFGMYLADTWYKLRADDNVVNSQKFDRQLDVAVLQDHLLRPLLAIDDPRSDKRITFVGGAGSVDELVDLVSRGEYHVAFSLYPTSMEQVMHIADAGKVMPPKSTWFEPKLLSGLVTYELA